MKTMVTRLTIAAACILAAGSGCAQASDEPRPAQKTLRKPVIREHAGTSHTPPPEAGRESTPPASSDDFVNRMADDLAKRLGSNKSELQVLTVESVVWNDGALGCPQPDKAYTQATVPGIRVLFQRAGKTYQYHGSERGYFVYCENPPEPAGKYDTK